MCRAPLLVEQDGAILRLRSVAPGPALPSLRSALEALDLEFYLLVDGTECADLSDDVRLLLDDLTAARTGTTFFLNIQPRVALRLGTILLRPNVEWVAASSDGSTRTDRPTSPPAGSIDRMIGGADRTQRTRRFDTDSGDETTRFFLL